MIEFKSEINEYEDCIKENISKLSKALREEDFTTINNLFIAMFGCTCVNNTPIYRFDCGDLWCSDCKKIFVRELCTKFCIKYGKKNNVKW